MEFSKTQLGSVVEQMKQAMLAGIPVVYIPTDEMEIVNRILTTRECVDSLVPRLCASESGGLRLLSPGETTIANPDTGKTLSICDNVRVGSPEPGTKLHVPTIFVSYADSWDKKAPAIVSFIQSFLGMKRSGEYNTPEFADNIRRSLCVVVMPEEKSVPPQIAPYTLTVRIPPLADEEIESVIGECLDEGRIDRRMVAGQLLNQMIISFRGFSQLRIRQMMRLMIARQSIDFDSVDANGVMSTIRHAKKQLLDSGNGLRWETSAVGGVAGLDSITRWIEQRKSVFDDTELARCQHMDIPNGVLVSGIPGSGKSLMAKTAANILGMPLVSLDMGALLGGVVGESEHNMADALGMAGRMAPCVLWIDEIEKAFSGSSEKSSASDGGVGRRMFGRFLTWMQEKSAACFVFATSNDITCLPPELFRSERFDRKFFTFMPMADECARIFAANIRAQNRAYERDLTSMPVRMRVAQAERLFDSCLETPRFWLDIINECCAADPDSCRLVDANSGKADNAGNALPPLYVWDTVSIPKNKLMTGADISALIKEAKFWIQPKPFSQNVPTVIYTKEKMASAVRHIMRHGSFKPYGETNLQDIARCFLKLYENRFTPASGQCILDFDRFDGDALVYRHNPECDGRFGNAYDRVLYCTLVGAVNRYLAR